MTKKLWHLTAVRTHSERGSALKHKAALFLAASMAFSAVTMGSTAMVFAAKHQYKDLETADFPTNSETSIIYNQSFEPADNQVGGQDNPWGKEMGKRPSAIGSDTYDFPDKAPYAPEGVLWEHSPTIYYDNEGNKAAFEKYSKKTDKSFKPFVSEDSRYWVREKQHWNNAEGYQPLPEGNGSYTLLLGDDNFYADADRKKASDRDERANNRFYESLFVYTLTVDASKLSPFKTLDLSYDYASSDEPEWWSIGTYKANDWMKTGVELSKENPADITSDRSHANPDYLNSHKQLESSAESYAAGGYTDLSGDTVYRGKEWKTVAMKGDLADDVNYVRLVFLSSGSHQHNNAIDDIKIKVEAATQYVQFRDEEGHIIKTYAVRTGTDMPPLPEDYSRAKWVGEDGLTYSSDKVAEMTDINSDLIFVLKKEDVRPMYRSAPDKQPAEGDEAVGTLHDEIPEEGECAEEGQPETEAEEPERVYMMDLPSNGILQYSPIPARETVASMLQKEDSAAEQVLTAAEPVTQAQAAAAASALPKTAAVSQEMVSAVERARSEQAKLKLEAILASFVRVLSGMASTK